MITDSFEIDGKEVGIHIVENKNDNCFSIFARDQDNHLFNGFEFRVKAKAFTSLTLLQESETTNIQSTTRYAYIIKTENSYWIVWRNVQSETL